MFKVGLTGGIASGKSTVSTIFINNGFKVLDADIIARDILVLYPELKEKIRKTFGHHFFDIFDDLKRKALAEYIFRYPAERIKLDNIMIPVIKEEIFSGLKKYESEGVELCIVDAPTLIEHGLHENMDMNILVWVDKNTQLNRLKKRDNITVQQALNRLSAQMNLDSKKECVDFIIDNTQSLESTRQQVEEISRILNMYK